jgi:hypothetical protein
MELSLLTLSTSALIAGQKLGEAMWGKGGHTEIRSDISRH